MKGRDISNFKKNDSDIREMLEKSGKGPALNIVKACAEALQYAYASCLNPADPYKQFFQYFKGRDYTPGREKMPKLMF